MLYFFTVERCARITSVGVVESYQTFDDAADIVALVKRLTVYSMLKLQGLEAHQVMLFRLIQHMEHPLSQAWLEHEGVLLGSPKVLPKSRIKNSKGSL